MALSCGEKANGEANLSGKEKTAPGALNKLLGELELEMMEWLWQQPPGELTVRQVFEAIASRRQPALAYTTIMTVMGHLSDKGLLTRRLEGKTHFYRVAQTRDEFIARSAARQVETLVADFGDLALAQFAEQLGGVSLQQLARIATLAQRNEDKEE
jgi:BlaI family transcriptional regulator, penicillinase repressor